MRLTVGIGVAVALIAVLQHYTEVGVGEASTYSTSAYTSRRRSSDDYST